MSTSVTEQTQNELKYNFARKFHNETRKFLNTDWFFFWFETMNSWMISKTSLFVVLQIVQLKYFFWTQCYCYFKRNLIQIVWNIDYSTWKSNVFRTDAINQEENCFERAVRYLILIPIIALWQRLTTLVYQSQGQAT